MASTDCIDGLYRWTAPTNCIDRLYQVGTTNRLNRRVASDRRYRCNTVTEEELAGVQMTPILQISLASSIANPNIHLLRSKLEIPSMCLTLINSSLEFPESVWKTKLNEYNGHFLERLYGRIPTGRRSGSGELHLHWSLSKIKKEKS